MSSVSFESREPGRPWAIGADSDPAAVRELRDECLRWLDARAAADAAARVLAERLAQDVLERALRPRRPPPSWRGPRP